MIKYVIVLIIIMMEVKRFLIVRKYLLVVAFTQSPNYKVLCDIQAQYYYEDVL